MAQWTDYWRIVKPQQAKDTYVATDTYNTGGGGAFDNFSWYTQMMQGAGSRLQDYNQYESMDGDVFVSRALDTIAEEMTNLDEKTNLPFEIAYQNDDNREVDETIVMTVKAAIRHWADTQDFNNRIFRISRMTVKYGDCFFRKVRDHKAWKYIPPRDISGIEIDEFGSVVAFHVKNHDQMGQHHEETIDRVEAQAMVHFTLSDTMGETAPFGESILKPSVRAYKQMGLLEDASVIYLTVRAPERKVFYVDVGNMPPHKVKSYLESVKNEIKQKRIPNNTGGQDDIDSVYNPTSMTEDYFFGSTANGRGSRVETLPGGTGLGEQDALKYFQEKVFLGLRVPTSYMKGGGDGGGAQYNDGKVGIAYIEEMRFANFVKRLQAKIERVLDIEFKEYLEKSGINIDEDLFKLQLPEPQNFALYRQAALDGELINTFNSAEGIKYLSKRFILKRYLGFTEDDVQTNEALLRQERAIDEDGDDLQRFYDPAYYENVETPEFGGGEDVEGGEEGDELAADDGASEEGSKPKRPSGGGPGAGLTDLEL